VRHPLLTHVTLAELNARRCLGSSVLDNERCALLQDTLHCRRTRRTAAFRNLCECGVETRTTTTSENRGVGACSSSSSCADLFSKIFDQHAQPCQRVSRVVKVDAPFCCRLSRRLISDSAHQLVERHHRVPLGAMRPKLRGGVYRGKDDRFELLQRGGVRCNDRRVAQRWLGGG